MKAYLSAVWVYSQNSMPLVPDYYVITILTSTCCLYYLHQPIYHGCHITFDLDSQNLTYTSTGSALWPLSTITPTSLGQLASICHSLTILSLLTSFYHISPHSACWSSIYSRNPSRSQGSLTVFLTSITQELAGMLLPRNAAPWFLSPHSLLTLLHAALISSQHSL